MDWKREQHAIHVKEWHKSWTSGVVEFMGRELITLDDVFPPSVDTAFYTEVAIEQAQFCVELYGSCDFFEIGVGSGAILLEVSSIDGVFGTGCDINPRAILCTKANAGIQNRGLALYVSNLFDNIPSQNFHIIFWNIPFNKIDPGGVEADKYRAGFDIGYKYLKRFLNTASAYLRKGGCVLLGVDDNEICDLDLIYSLSQGVGWKIERIAEKQVNDPVLWKGGENTKLVVLKLTRS